MILFIGFSSLFHNYSVFFCGKEHIGSINILLNKEIFSMISVHKNIQLRYKVMMIDSCIIKNLALPKERSGLCSQLLGSNLHYTC